MYRYPIIERVVAEAPLLSETSFVSAIRASLQRILDELMRGRSTSGSAPFVSPPPFSLLMPDQGPTDPPNANSGGSCYEERSPSRAGGRLPNGDVADSDSR